MNNPLIEKWLSKTLDISAFSLIPIEGGANNQGFCVKGEKSNWFLKAFAPDAEGANAKLVNEFNFSSYLWRNNIRDIPKPIAISEEMNVALYGFIHGKKIEKATEEHVTAAYHFIASINQIRIPSSRLQIASESADSICGFYHIIENRLRRFNNLKNQDNLNRLLLKIKDRADSIVSNAPLHWNEPLKRDVLSPSDFGFHNALINKERIAFFDFEYAGHDTCWKLLSDFFSQPAVPVDLKYLDIFLNNPLFSDIAKSPQEFKAVFELTQLKWCLIMLNEFLRDIQMRRQFSWNNTCLKNQDIEEIQHRQLLKSQAYFNEIDNQLEQLSDIYAK